MKLSSFLPVFLYLTLLLFLGFLLGKLMFKVITSSEAKLEEKFLKWIGIDAQYSMTWREYAFSLLALNLLGLIALQLLLMFQNVFPLNPEGRPGLSFWMAFNIATSFVTNTNWQNYGGESTLSYFVQMVGLTVQNFLSAATGIGVMLIFVRALNQKESHYLGNFWSDISRITLRILLPLSFVFALFLVSQGVPQTTQGAQIIHTLEGKELKIPLGPVASQVAIKMNGTNGGGFFNANASHPYENPTPLSNFISSISILLIPFACAFLFVFMMKDKRQGYTVFGVMFVLLILGLTVSIWGNSQINPMTKTAYLEGVDTRITPQECSLWSVATTAVSNGSVNCAHSSLSPTSQIVTLFNMMTGEIIFGGAGAGVYGMLLYVLLTVFLAGLMVGRTPEYLGKKIEANEVTWIGVALLLPGLLNLCFTALSLNLNSGLASLAHSGPHGLTEVLYAYSSTFGNNGSAFAGLNANTTFYNMMTSLAMLIGRFVVMMPVLYLSGRLAIKKISPMSAGTLRTDTLIFSFLLFTVILIMGALTFFPALVLGPIAEQMMATGI